MSFSGKYTSLISVIEKAFRDSGADNIDFENAIEWSVELMGLIGVPSIYVEKTTSGIDGMPSALLVENYRAKMPDDCERVISVRKAIVDTAGNVVGSSPMTESSNIFHPTNQTNSLGNTTTEWNPLVNIDTFDPATEEFVHTIEQYEIDGADNRLDATYSYKLDQGYIFTNFKDGYILMAYLGLPIDADGFPMIPDDEKFKEALKWHIISKIDLRNWRINASPQNAAIRNDSEQRRDFYVAAARNKAHIPSIDKMEAIKNMWLRTIPKINEHKNGFATLNVSEQRYNQRWRRT